MSADNARRLAAYGRRSFTRDGWHYRIRGIAAENGRLIIDAEFTESATDRVIAEQIRFTNASLRVPDGEEPNPEFNALDTRSKPTRAKFREDAAEAIKIHLQRGLAEAKARG